MTTRTDPAALIKALMGDDFSFAIDDPAQGGRVLAAVVDYVLDTYDLDREAASLLAYTYGLTESSRT
jgi:hypothetical protein